MGFLLSPTFSASFNSRFGLQSSGSSVQFPLGQRDASIAEHWPMQLVPWPQVTLVRVVSRAQQGTWIDSFEKVKAESKKSRFNVVMLPLKYHDVIYLHSSHGSLKAYYPAEKSEKSFLANPSYKFFSLFWKHLFRNLKKYPFCHCIFCPKKGLFWHFLAPGGRLAHADAQTYGWTD